MNRSKIAVLVFSMLTALTSALAQTPAPGGGPAAAPAASSAASPNEETKPPTRSNRDAATEADARSCLDLPSNLEVIKCAEKYRSHKRTG
jgi:hypothetical protein